MIQTTVLWILGGWFVLAAIVGLVVGRMMSMSYPAERRRAVEAPISTERTVEQIALPWIAA